MYAGTDSIHPSEAKKNETKISANVRDEVWLESNPVNCLLKNIMWGDVRENGD